MTRITKAQRAWEAASIEAQAKATEQGETWFKLYPEALLIEAYWEAHRRFGPDDPHAQCVAFVLGVINARRRHDEYLNEQKGNQL